MSTQINRAFYRRLALTLVLFALLFSQSFPTVATVYAEEASESATGAADWLEPRGINVVDLVGLVPEDHLQNAILVYETGRGLLQYESGQRSGDTVVINARVTPRYFIDNGVTFSKFSCLGQPGVYDQWPAPAPAATLRVYDQNGVDITANTAVYIPIASGQVQPNVGSSGYMRYAEQGAQPVQFAQDGSVILPANQGCVVIVRGQYNNFRAQFTMTAPQQIRVTALGSETFSFHSYIGVGSSGLLGSLNGQMNSRYGDRHEKFQLTPPAESEYVLVNYPPTPIDPYAGQDAVTYSLPGSGTYRIARSGNDLSVDHLNTMGLPLRGQWQDSDQKGGDYLSFFSDGVRISTPEYFLPAGIPYNACMTDGGCSDNLLDQIYNATMELKVHYYKVDRIVDGLTRTPLRQVGPAWRPGRALAATQANATQANAKQEEMLYLPIVFTIEETVNLPGDDTSGCPCGWFTADGRMVDYIAPAN
ncbi:MAG: hypothetical protein R3E79_38455 [Caldilineaceae bacterium]